MKENDLFFAMWLLAMAIAATALVVGVMVKLNVDASWKNEAVARGAAEYYVDGSRQTMWRWKAPSVPERNEVL